MTQQDDITQRVLTDDEIIKHLEDAGVTFMWVEGRNPLHMTAGSQQVDALLAGIRALLSKLRAPVADERTAQDYGSPADVAQRKGDA